MSYSDKDVQDIIAQLRVDEYCDEYARRLVEGGDNGKRAKDDLRVAMYVSYPAETDAMDAYRAFLSAKSKGGSKGAVTFYSQGQFDTAQQEVGWFISRRLAIAMNVHMSQKRRGPGVPPRSEQAKAGKQPIDILRKVIAKYGFLPTANVMSKLMGIPMFQLEPIIKQLREEYNVTFGSAKIGLTEEGKKDYMLTWYVFHDKPAPPPKTVKERLAAALEETSEEDLNVLLQLLKGK